MSAGLADCQRRLDQAAVGARAAGSELRRERIDRDPNAAGNRSKDEQVGGIGIDRNVDRRTLEHVPLGPRRDSDHGKGLAAVERRASLRIGVCANRYAHSAARIQRFYDPAAQLAEIIADHGDRDLAQDLVQIWLRVIDAISQRAED